MKPSRINYFGVLCVTSAFGSCSLFSAPAEKESVQVNCHFDDALAGHDVANGNETQAALAKYNWSPGAEPVDSYVQ